MGTKALVLPWVPAANFCSQSVPSHTDENKQSCHRSEIKTSPVLDLLFEEVLVSAKGVDEGDRD